MLDFRDAISGAVGAACLTLCGAPFDTVKLRVQARLAGSPLEAARAILRHEGAAALWRGAGPAFASHAVENVVLFASQGLFRRLAAAERAVGHHPHPVEHVLLGGLSGALSATAICPAEVVKIRMQGRAVLRGGAAPAGAWAVATSIVRHEGARALFSGLRPLLLRDVPFNAIFMGAYRNLTQAYRVTAGLGADAPVPTHVTMLAGGCSGAAAWAVVFPADVLKSRAQVAGASSGAPASMLVALRAVLAEGGVRALYRGCSAALLRSFPANAALLWGVETTDALLRPSDPQSGGDQPPRCRHDACADALSCSH